jgi:hypothetical protein
MWRRRGWCRTGLNKSNGGRQRSGGGINGSASYGGEWLLGERLRWQTRRVVGRVCVRKWVAGMCQAGGGLAAENDERRDWVFEFGGGCTRDGVGGTVESDV